MPPALSDDDMSVSSAADEIPFREKKASAEPADAAPADTAESEDEGDEDEYVVEKIMSHKVKGRAILYEVKWQGYEKKADRTWEEEENLIEGATEALQDYWEEIGGKPEIGSKGSGKKRGRKSNVESEQATPVAASKRLKKEKDWSPPPGSWEHDVQEVETVEENTDPKTGKKVRYAYLVWTNKHKTQHPLEHVYLKCPQKMLQYYEQHLVFTDNTDEHLNGAEKGMVTGEV